MPITLRPAQTFVTLGNADVRDDFDVMEGGRRIGRIYHAEAGREAWCWNVSRAISPSGFAGRAATRVLALQMLVDTYRAVKELENAECQCARQTVNGPSRPARPSNRLPDRAISVVRRTGAPADVGTCRSWRR
ncbi:MAG: hypothetical protein GEU95_09560 [Rhizobiales bacterium]|nr:hypothetical protein [Hyphomicrobiales bacterium]